MIRSLESWSESANESHLHANHVDSARQGAMAAGQYAASAFADRQVTVFTEENREMKQRAYQECK
jgi:hypothetical protein